MSARAAMAGPARLSRSSREPSTPWAWRLAVAGLKGAGSVVAGICHALGTVVYVVCTIVEAMAVIFLLGSMGGKR